MALLSRLTMYVDICEFVMIMTVIGRFRECGQRYLIQERALYRMQSGHLLCNLCFKKNVEAGSRTWQTWQVSDLSGMP